MATEIAGRAYTLTVDLEIDDDADAEEIAAELRHVAQLIDDGYTSGILNGGSWDLNARAES